MSPKGVINAILRLNGARKFGSTTLLAQAKAEADHALKQARIWLQRSEERETRSESHAEMQRAALELEQLIAKATL